MIKYLALALCLSALHVCFTGILHGAEQESAPKVASSLSVINDQMLELYGKLYGQPYWIRLSSPDQRFGGNRIMQLVYVPRKPAENATTVNEDHPFLLLNGKAQIIAWNERGSGLSGFEYRTNRENPGYAINIERSRTDENGDLVPIEVRVNFTSPTPIWDGHLAPLMLALTYQSAALKDRGDIVIPAVDFFGPQTPLKLSPLVLTDNTVTLPNGLKGTITADEQGRLKSITGPDGAVIFTVTAWLSDKQATP